MGLQLEKQLELIQGFGSLWSVAAQLISCQPLANIQGQKLGCEWGSFSFKGGFFPPPGGMPPLMSVLRDE